MGGVKMETLTIGDVRVSWLNGGDNHLDGGAMFGVVPKELWSKKYPTAYDNRIPMRTDPLLVQTGNEVILIDAGIGNGMIEGKQKKHFGITEESNVETDLMKLGLTRHDVTKVAMTHMHFDHVAGLTTRSQGKLESTFPNAVIYVSDVEWNEMQNPNIRSKNTYWKQNWEAIESQVVPFHDSLQLLPEFTMHHTGGHSDGHSVIVISSQSEQLVHMGDLLPTHAHHNVLWVMAYDDFPMTSISQKEKWLQYAYNQNAWLSFYHDAYYRAIKWDTKGHIINAVKFNQSLLSQ